MQVLPPSSTGGPSRLFIMRPVATTLLMVAILLAGIIGYRTLPVSALPEVDYPTIQVVTLYPGASPDVMTSAVTAPLERQFGQMSGLKQMSSQSSGGASVITLQFQLTLPLDVAEQEVQAAINAATNLLPSDLPNPPVYSKVNPADPPIMTLAVTSTAMPMTQVEDMVETRVAQKISQISGVGLVTLSGGQRPAVRVKLNAQAIAALGLTSETVRTAITGANVNSAKGSLDGPSRAVTLSANDQMQSAEEYRQLIIAYQNGAPIRLGDVATVEQGAENSWLGAWANKEQAIVMNVQRQPGANIISTADSIRQYGVLVPAIARPDPNGGYELVAGHRRHRASELAGKDTMPVIVRDLDDDQATIIMVDSNLQRESLLPSERAFAYKMKLEAMKHQGERSDLTSSQVGTKLRADEVLAQQAGSSRNQVQRYIRLTELIPELLDMVDEKKIAFNPAYELSFLKKEEQTQLLDAMDSEQATPSLSQAQRLKKYSQEGHLTLDMMRVIMGEEKKSDLDKITFTSDTLRKYFPRSYTPARMQETIIKLLEAWQRKRQRDQER